jgi:hypothetical protein
MRIPFFAIKNIRADGSGWKPGASVKWAARTKVASMMVASIIANDAPMQILGPAPNGMY